MVRQARDPGGRSARRRERAGEGRRAARSLRCLTGAALLGLGLAAGARADTFVVDTVQDNVAGSLREAVDGANASAGGDTITFNLPASSQLLLDTQLLLLAGSVVVDGSGVSGLRIAEPANLGPVFTATATNDLTLRDIGYTGFVSLANGLILEQTLAGTESRVDGLAAPLGTPSVTKLGPGTTRILGTFDFSSALGGVVGLVSVQEGVLALDGSILVQRFELAPGGALAGNGGTVTAFDLDLSGRVAPETRTGALTLTGTGAVEFRGSSVLEIDLVPGDDGDVLQVAGAAPRIRSGAQLQILADPADFPNPGDSTTHTVLVSQDADIQGQFQVLAPFVFGQPNVVNGPRDITVTITRAGAGLFESAARTENQRVVGRLLDQDTGALANVITALQAESIGAIPGLLDAIGGEPLTASATARQWLAERSARALQRRVRDPAWGASRAAYAAQPADTELPEVSALGRSALRPSAWFDSFGALGRLEGGGGAGAADLDTWLSGATLGADLWHREGFVLGAAAGYAYGAAEPDGRDQDLSAHSIQAAIYGGWSAPEGFASLYGRYAHSFLESERRIEGVALDRSAEADWTAQDWGGGAEAGLTLWSGDYFGFQPVAGVDYLRLEEESYRESGAGELSLVVDPEALESLTTRVGARLFGDLELDGAGRFVPELRAFWQHEFGDRDRVLRATLAGAAVPVRGAELPRDTAILGLGWSAAVAETLSVLLDYDALLGAERVEHQATLALRLRF